jgi:hypothetical protein
LGTYGGISDKTSKNHAAISLLVTVDCSKKKPFAMTLEKRADLSSSSSLHDYRWVGATDRCIQTALKP